MKVMVFNVPAETSGALSILLDFYKETLDIPNIEWVFVLSTPEIEETKNISVLNFPWIKKSLFHRFIFDYFIANSLVKKNKIDKVVSFHNVSIPFVSVDQYLYVHNAIPFTKYNFSLTKEPKLWFYNKIYPFNILRSVKKSHKVIVQTEWMKRKLTNKSNVNKEKVVVVRPPVNVKVNKTFDLNNTSDIVRFFYPSSPYNYKNHLIIYLASKRLVEEDFKSFEVVFTLEGNETEEIKKIKEQSISNNIPIIFAGKMNRENVFSEYSKSILIFPSKIETVGLPLIEAMLHECFIIAAKEDYSTEILQDYRKKFFFDSDDEIHLARLMKEVSSIKEFKKEKIELSNESIVKAILD